MLIEKKKILLLVLIALILSITGCQSNLSKAQNSKIHHNDAITFNDALKKYPYAKSIEWKSLPHKKVQLVKVTVTIDKNKIPDNLTKMYYQELKLVNGLGLRIIFRVDKNGATVNKIEMWLNFKSGHSESKYCSNKKEILRMIYKEAIDRLICVEFSGFIFEKYDEIINLLNNAKKNDFITFEKYIEHISEMMNIEYKIPKLEKPINVDPHDFKKINERFGTNFKDAFDLSSKMQELKKLIISKKEEEQNKLKNRLEELKNPKFRFIVKRYNISFSYGKGEDRNYDFKKKAILLSCSRKHGGWTPYFSCPPEKFHNWMEKLRYVEEIYYILHGTWSDHYQIEGDTYLDYMRIYRTPKYKTFRYKRVVLILKDSNENILHKYISKNYDKESGVYR